MPPKKRWKNFNEKNDRPHSGHFSGLHPGIRFIAALHLKSQPYLHDADEERNLIGMSPFLLVPGSRRDMEEIQNGRSKIG